MTIEPARFYMAMVLLALMGAAFAIFNTTILKPPEHPITLRIIRCELFIFVALIALFLLTRRITVNNTTAVAASFFGSSTFRIDEINGYLHMSNGPTSSYYLLNRENKVLFGFSNILGMRVFEEEEELVQWIESFDLLNAESPLPAIRMKLSGSFLMGTLFFVSIPFQIIGLEMWLSMWSAK